MVIFLLVLACLACASGAVALISVIFFWDKFENNYSQLHAKYALAIARAAGAASAIAARAISDDSTVDVANVATGVGVLAFLFWEIAQCLSESRVSATLKSLRLEVYSQHLLNNQLHRQLAIQTAMIAVLRRLVNAKKERLAIASQRPVRQRLVKLLSSLDPEEHMREIIAALAISLRSLHKAPSSGDAIRVNIRVALYVPIDGYMVPWVGYDDQNGRYDPFTSYLKHKDRFWLANETNPSQTVRCVRENRSIIIADAAASGVQFFTDKQRNYLQSLVAHPFNGIRSKDGSIVDGALVVDANVAGLFQEADREVIVFLLNEFASRLTLESHLVAFTEVPKR